VTQPNSPDPSALHPADLPSVAAEIIAEQIARDHAEPMRPGESVDALRRALPLPLDGGSLTWPDTLALLRQVLAATPTTTSRRFFNQLFGGRDPVATIAELATVLSNSPMHTFKASGVQVLVERAVLDRMGALAGLSGGDGSITPGGSLSNMMGLLLARNAAEVGARDRGLSGNRLCTYTSVASHYSVTKAAGVVGMGRDNVRRIPIDPAGGMRVDALVEQIERDQAAGACPVVINATAGTTVLGAFDPLPQLADVAARYGIWLHVDAAYGGSILFSSRHRHLLEGTERADSLTWDAHKLLGVPLTCSALLTRKPGACTEALDEPASYLFQEQALPDPGRGSFQCGRHNDALKLWLSWKHHGDAGMAARIDRLFGLAEHAAARVAASPGAHLVREPASFNVCFTVDGVDAARLCRGLWEHGIAKVGHAEVDGAPVVRWVFVNPEVTTDDVDAVFDEMLKLAPTLS